MDGQFLANRPINVSYAFKKDGRGERHGTAAERLLAAQAKKNIQQQPMYLSTMPASALYPPPLGIPGQMMYPITGIF